MKLLDALVKDIEQKQPGVTNARMVHFAFSSTENAYLSEIPLDELVPLLEEWCKERRIEMGPVN